MLARRCESPELWREIDWDLVCWTVAVITVAWCRYGTLHQSIGKLLWQFKVQLTLSFHKNHKYIFRSYSYKYPTTVYLFHKTLHVFLSVCVCVRVHGTTLEKCKRQPSCTLGKCSLMQMWEMIVIISLSISGSSQPVMLLESSIHPKSIKMGSNASHLHDRAICLNLCFTTDVCDGDNLPLLEPLRLINHCCVL